MDWRFQRTRTGRKPLAAERREANDVADQAQPFQLPYLHQWGLQETAGDKLEKGMTSVVVAYARAACRNTPARSR